MFLLLWLCILPLAITGPLKASELVSEECVQCRLTVNLFEKKWGEDALDCTGDLVIYLCTTFEVETNYICKAMASNYKDEIEYVLSSVITSPKQVCSLLLGNCGTFFDPLNVTWQLPMPPNKPPVVEKKKVQGLHPTTKVLHLTDLHMDMDYQIGAEAQCTNTMALCCRPLNDPDELSFSTDVKQPAGHWGTTGMCDAPYWFVDDMLGQIAKQHTDLSYILLTGDLESHAVWDYTKEEHVQRISNVSRLIANHFPTTPVYFAIGNHEGVPLDSFAPHFTPSQFHMDWLYDSVADNFGSSIPADQMNTVKYNGCFMKKLFPGLRLISLNNGYGDNLNFFLLVNQTDPDGTMSWFIDQLLQAEMAGDKVHIIAHIPGGTTEGLEGWSLNYYRAVIRFENTITAQFFGHVHSENFYMFYADPEDHRSRPIDVIYSAPSVTAYSRYNPAYRIYTVDGPYLGASYQVIDWQEFMFNLTANNLPPYNPLWTTLYSSVVQEYGMAANLPFEWNNVIERMKTDDALFAKFLKNFYRRLDYPACDAKCRNEHLCALRKAHHSTNLCDDLEGATGMLEPDHPKHEPNEFKTKTTYQHPKRWDDKCSI